MSFLLAADNVTVKFSLAGKGQNSNKSHYIGTQNWAMKNKGDMPNMQFAPMVLLYLTLLLIYSKFNSGLKMEEE